MVQPRSPPRPPHILLRVLRQRMAVAQQSWLSPGAGFGARSRHLRSMRTRLSGGVANPQTPARSPAHSSLGRMGSQTRPAQLSLGRGPCPARSGRRRRMRLVQHPDSLPPLPSPLDRRTSRPLTHFPLAATSAPCPDSPQSSFPRHVPALHGSARTGGARILSDRYYVRSRRADGTVASAS